MAHRTRGFALELKGELDLAIADYTRAIELDPSKNDFYVRRGLSYQKRGNLELAGADFHKALSIWPEDPIAKTKLAQLSSQQPQDCKEGADVSISGTITSVQDGYLEVQQNKPGCKIYGIAISELPSQCVQEQP